MSASTDHIYDPVGMNPTEQDELKILISSKIDREEPINSNLSAGSAEAIPRLEENDSRGVTGSTLLTESDAPGDSADATEPPRETDATQKTKRFAKSLTADVPPGHVHFGTEEFKKHTDKSMTYAISLGILGIAVGVLMVHAITKASLVVGIVVILLSTFLMIWGLYSGYKQRPVFLLIYGITACVLCCLILGYTAYCCYNMAFGGMAVYDNVMSLLHSEDVDFPNGVRVRQGVKVEEYLERLIADQSNLGTSVQVNDLPLPSNAGLTLKDSIRVFTNYKYRGIVCGFTYSTQFVFRKWPVGCESTCALGNAGDKGFTTTLEAQSALSSDDRFLCEYYAAYTGAEMLNGGYHFWWALISIISIILSLISICVIPMSAYNGIKAYRVAPSENCSKHRRFHF